MTDSVSRRASSRGETAVPHWMREPLIHFLVVGALLFAIDHFIASRADDPRTIVVNADVDREARQLFKASRDREPDREELDALRRIWLDNEVLYREGMALQVDRGDTAIRERVIFKALSLIDANTRLPPFDDKLLHAWFEKHRTKYDEPTRFNFEEAVLADSAAEAAVRAFVDALNAGTPGDAKAGLRVFKGRPHANLVQSYGPDFVQALATSPVQKWHALPTRGGWRAIRLDSIEPAVPASFEVLRGVVQQDWTDATLAAQRSAAVRALAKQYTVKFEDAKK